MRLILAVLVALSTAAVPSQAKNLPLTAVQKLSAHYFTQGWSCTAWAYKFQGGAAVWLTNYHCIASETGEPLLDAEYKIGDKEAEPVAGNPERDLAMLRLVGAELPGQKYLQLATRQARFADPVMRIGYPGGVLAVSAGIVSNPALSWEHSPFPVMLADYHGGPGSSGSPVLDSSGRVTGMHAFAWGPYAGGPTLADLKLFLFGQ